MRLFTKKLKALILFGALIIFPVIVHAAGVNVSPPRLEINDYGKAMLTVSNPTKEQQRFMVSADDNQNALIIEPAEFDLAGNAKQQVTISLAGKLPGSPFATNLSIIAAPVKAGDSSVASGIKIPLTVKTSPSLGTPEPPSNDTDHYRLFIGGVALAILILAGALKARFFNK